LAALVAMPAAAAFARSASDTPPPPTVADPVKGLDLWRGAKVGMTVDDVRRLFPLAAAAKTPNILTGGQVDLLQLGDADLGGRPATAHFYFKGPELQAVELTASGFKPGAPAANMALAKGLADGYAAALGPGYDCGSRSLADIDIYECKWLKGRLSIQLLYMDVAGQAPLFYVAYRQADDPSYNL